MTKERSFVVLYYTDDVKLDQIPLLPNGKLDKKTLIMPDPECCRSAYEPPENELEVTLLKGFQKIHHQYTCSRCVSSDNPQI